MKRFYLNHVWDAIVSGKSISTGSAKRSVVLFRRRHQCEWGKGAKEFFQELSVEERHARMIPAETLKREPRQFLEFVSL